MSWLDIATVVAILFAIGQYGPANGPNLLSRLWKYLSEDKEPAVFTPTPPDVRPTADPVVTPMPLPAVVTKEQKLSEAKDLLIRSARLLLDTGNTDEAAKVFELVVEISSGGA